MTNYTHDQNIANDTGANVRADINSALQALFSNSSSTSAPATTIIDQFWMDRTAGLWKKRNAANSGWLSMRTLDESFVLARSSNTILGVSDVGKFFRFTSSFTQTFTAAATLGDGWYIDFVNEGSGAITFDPNSSETIDGATTLVVASGEFGRIVCNGTNFKIIGRRLGTITNDSATAGVVAEIIESTVLVGSAVSLTNGAAANVTSISLTAGDWDVWGNVAYTVGGTTNFFSGSGSISTTSATHPTIPNGGAYARFSLPAGAPLTGDSASIAVGMKRISVASTTTVYLVTTSSFNVSTCAAYGYLGARRRR